MTEKSSIDALGARFADIEANYCRIRENIALAAQRAGRKESDVRFMAVTKTVEPALINHALSLGVRLIGENKVQELLSKLEYLSDPAVEKHIIGHLQSNKARKIIGVVSMVQSVDSVSIAKELSLRAAQSGAVMPVLMEINIGREESKTGFAPEAAAEAAAEIGALPGVSLRGLMAVPPMEAPEKELRGYFAAMRRMFEDLRGGFPAMDTLSLGMSADYPVAIEEGATLVRVGSALFGSRRY